MSFLLSIGNAVFKSLLVIPASCFFNLFVIYSTRFSIKFLENQFKSNIHTDDRQVSSKNSHDSINLSSTADMGEISNGIIPSPRKKIEETYHRNRVHNFGISRALLSIEYFAKWTYLVQAILVGSVGGFIISTSLFCGGFLAVYLLGYKADFDIYCSSSRPGTSSGDSVQAATKTSKMSQVWRICSNSNYYTGILFTFLTKHPLDIEFKISGDIEQLQKIPAVFVANHQSTLDLLSIASFFPQHTVVIAKSSLFYYPLLGIHLYLSQNIFIHRSNRKSAISTLSEGAVGRVRKEGVGVFMFPEGTRSGKGLLKFKKGAFYLGVQANIPIVPIVISEYDQGAIYDLDRWRFRGGTIHIKVLTAVYGGDSLAPTDLSSNFGHFEGSKSGESIDSHIKDLVQKDNEAIQDSGSSSGGISKDSGIHRSNQVDVLTNTGQIVDEVIDVCWRRMSDCLSEISSRPSSSAASSSTAALKPRITTAVSRKAKSRHSPKPPPRSSSTTTLNEEKFH